MRIINSVSAMQRLARRWKRTGKPIALVPTMGYLHEGHVSLIARARRLAGPDGQVVVSIYVNPTQFGPKDDLAKYPRDFKHDTSICRAARVTAIFAPSDHEMYGTNDGQSFRTFVTEQNLSQGMEGASRPTHFRGVTTVVAKLFNIVSPDFAVFGEKDFQQLTVIRRMVRDLNFTVRIMSSPTVREPDGLAMSSRNRYLSPDERRQAVVLWQAIQRARTSVRGASVPVSAKRLWKQLNDFIAAQPAARVDYVVFFDPETWQTVSTIKRGIRMALAVWVGSTRLIDNAEL